MDAKFGVAKKEVKPDKQAVAQASSLPGKVGQAAWAGVKLLAGKKAVPLLEKTEQNSSCSKSPRKM